MCLHRARRQLLAQVSPQPCEGTVSGMHHGVLHIHFQTFHCSKPARALLAVLGQCTDHTTECCRLMLKSLSSAVQVNLWPSQLHRERLTHPHLPTLAGLEKHRSQYQLRLHLNQRPHQPLMHTAPFQGRQSTRQQFLREFNQTAVACMLCKATVDLSMTPGQPCRRAAYRASRLARLPTLCPWLGSTQLTRLPMPCRRLPTRPLPAALAHPVSLPMQPPQHRAATGPILPSGAAPVGRPGQRAEQPGVVPGPDVQHAQACCQPGVDSGCPSRLTARGHAEAASP